jgi:MraZ protein
MAALPRFTGSVSTTLDAKNRLTIPARFRDELLRDAAGGGRVVVSRWVDPCLVIHPQSEWERRCEEIGRMRDADPERRQFRYVIMGTAQDLEIDKQNRILLPQPLRDAASVTKEITLVGDIDRILIWDSERWAQTCDLSNERLSQMYERFYSEPPPGEGQ